MQRVIIIALLMLAMGSNSIKAVDSIDDLKNSCSYSPTPSGKRLMDATAMLVHRGMIHFNSSNNTYSIDNAPITEAYEGAPLCSTSKFFNEPQTFAARSGFLVTPNMVMTAPHLSTTYIPPGGTPFDPLQWMVVFRAKNSSPCADFRWDGIPAQDVFNTTEMMVDTLDNAPSNRYDYMVLKLDRYVVNRLPMKIRRSGAPRKGDRLLVAGFPLRAGQKIDVAGRVGEHMETYRPDVLLTHPGNDVFENLHTLVGDSGAPIYNVEDDVIEAVVSYGIGNGNWVKSASGCYNFAQSNLYRSSDFNGPTADVESSIPRSEVLVKPLDYIRRVLDLGPGQSFQETYAIQSATSNGGETVTIGSIQGPSGLPSDVPQLSTSLSPGSYIVPSSGINFAMTADIGSLSKCGAWDYELNVRDETSGQDNKIRQRLEVGLREFSVYPDDEWKIEKLTPPFNMTRTYTIKNIRPTPTHVIASGDTTWPGGFLARVDGTGYRSFDLGPAGSATDTATFTVSIDEAAAATTAIGSTYRGNVAIYNQPYNCSVSAVSTNRFFTFTRGVQDFQSVDETQLMVPYSGPGFGPATRFDVDLSDVPYGCVGDIDLDTGLFLNFAMSFELTLQYMRIDLTSPSGATGILWSGQAPPNDAYRSSISAPTFGDSLPALHLDDSSSPPLGGTMLSHYAGPTQKLKGHWYVDIRTSTSNTIAAGPTKLRAKLLNSSCLF